MEGKDITQFLKLNNRPIATIKRTDNKLTAASFKKHPGDRTLSLESKPCFSRAAPSENDEARSIKAEVDYTKKDAARELV